MESRHTTRDHSGGAIRDRLLSDRLAPMRRCRSRAWRISACAGVVARSASPSARRGNDFVARDGSVTVAALYERRIQIYSAVIDRRYNSNPHSPQQTRTRDETKPLHALYFPHSVFRGERVLERAHAAVGRKK